MKKAATIFALGLAAAVVASVAFGAARGSGSPPAGRSLHDVTADVLTSEPIFSKAHGIDCSYLHGPSRLLFCTMPGVKIVYLFKVGADGRTRLVGGVR